MLSCASDPSRAKSALPEAVMSPPETLNCETLATRSPARARLTVALALPPVGLTQPIGSIAIRASVRSSLASSVAAPPDRLAQVEIGAHGAVDRSELRAASGLPAPPGSG